MAAKTAIKLQSGSMMPLIGLGTWLSEPGEVGNAVRIALKLGYKHFDCAAVYGNEKEIGDVFQEAFNAGTVNRGDIFITSKLWNSQHRAKDVKKACLQSISDLQCQYLDLYLIHWPISFNEKNQVEFVPLAETWKAMEELVDSGLVKNIGLSNYNCSMICDLLSYCRIKPAVLQIECHPYFPQKDLIEYVQKQGITVTAYSPLGNPGFHGHTEQTDANTHVLLRDPVITEIANKVHKSPAQVLLRWQIQRDVVVIPKSTHEERIKTNFDVFSFSLSGDDMNKIWAISKTYNVRSIDPNKFWKVPLYA